MNLQEFERKLLRETCETFLSVINDALSFLGSVKSGGQLYEAAYRRFRGICSEISLTDTPIA